MNATVAHMLSTRPDTFTPSAQTYQLVLRHLSSVIMSETMHLACSAVFSNITNATLSIEV